MSEPNEMATATINTDLLVPNQIDPSMLAANNNNYASSEPVIMPSRIRHAVDDFLAGIELQAARVATGMNPADELEEDIQGMIETAKMLDPGRTRQVQKNLTAPLREYKVAPRFQAYRNIDPTQAGELERVDLASRNRMKVTNVVNNWVHIPTVVNGLSVATDDLMPQGGYTNLKIYLSKVKCVKETRWEWGSDEISCGTAFVDETGDFSYRSPFNVSSDFDKGETKNYGYPGKYLQNFNLREAGNKFPKIYTCSFSLIERDWGSISGWFKKFVVKLNQRIKSYLNQLGIKVGEKLGLGPASGLIGSIFNKVWDFIVKFFKGLFGHDHLGTKTLQFTINGYGGNWTSTGNHTTSGWMKFNGHKGDYRVQWRTQLAK